MNATTQCFTHAIINYWTFTVGLAWELGFGGFSDLMRREYVRVTVAHLGYPSYLLSIIGFWKVLAAIVRLAPRFPLAKKGPTLRYCCLLDTGSTLSSRCSPGAELASSGGAR